MDMIKSIFTASALALKGGQMVWAALRLSVAFIGVFGHAEEQQGVADPIVNKVQTAGSGYNNALSGIANFIDR